MKKSEKTGIVITRKDNNSLHNCENCYNSIPNTIYEIKQYPMSFAVPGVKVRYLCKRCAQQQYPRYFLPLEPPKNKLPKDYEDPNQQEMFDENP